MSIIESAKSEMRLAGYDVADTEVMVEILRKFLTRWDSGGAVWAMAPVLMRLLNNQPLTPISGAGYEWIDRSEISSSPMWQNERCSSVFKDGTGKAWDIDNPSWDGAFPYEPPLSLPGDPVIVFDTVTDYAAINRQQKGEDHS
jgi:hypothetical protein